MATPYTGNSIVDYLKTAGQDASYGNRANIYKTANLNMGEYGGTAQQNTALLNYLRGSSSSSPAPSPAPTPSPLPTPSPTVSSPATTRTSFVDTQANQLMSKQAEQQAKVDASRKSLIDFYASLEDPTTRYNRIAGEQGLSEQQSLVNALTKQSMQQTDLLDEIEPSVNQRSGDFFINEADRVALVARESNPVIKELNKILRNKQYEEIGLQGKQNLVTQLLQLSIQGDEQRARPLTLGVDYSQKDMDSAMELLSSLTSTRINAFNADQSATESKQAADLDWQRTLEKMAKSQEYSKELENLQSSNQLSRSLSLKSSDTTDEAKSQKTENAWNSILAGASTEYDVWKKIDENQDKLRSEGVDVDELWAKHAALAGKVGLGKAVRSDSSSGAYY